MHTDDNKNSTIGTVPQDEGGKDEEDDSGDYEDDEFEN